MHFYSYYSTITLILDKTIIYYSKLFKTIQNYSKLKCKKIYILSISYIIYVIFLLICFLIIIIFAN